MTIVDIRDAIVLGNGLNCYTSDTSGSTVASFTVGCKEYDARYEKNTRYNNSNFGSIRNGGTRKKNEASKRKHGASVGYNGFVHKSP